MPVVVFTYYFNFFLIFYRDMRVAPGSGAVLQGRPGPLDFENPKHILNYSVHMLVALMCMCWWLRDKKEVLGCLADLVSGWKYSWPCPDVHKCWDPKRWLMSSTRLLICLTSTQRCLIDRLCPMSYICYGFQHVDMAPCGAAPKVLHSGRSWVFRGDDRSPSAP